MFFIKEDGSNGVAVFSETAGQFTGLKDKNGNKIYEGDILFYNGNYRKIKFHNHGFWNMSMNEKSKFPITLYEHVDQLDYDEVIGNVHD